MAVPPAMTIYGVTTVTPEREGGSGPESLHVLPPGSRFEIGGHSFLPFFFAEKIEFLRRALASVLLHFSLLWHAILFVCTSFDGGTSVSRKPIVPFARNPIVSRPWSIVSGSSRELLFVLLPPIICVEVMRAYEKESVWGTADLGDRDLWGWEYWNEGSLVFEQGICCYSTEVSRFFPLILPVCFASKESHCKGRANGG